MRRTMKMKIRQTKKIMNKSSDSPKYLKFILISIDNVIHKKAFPRLEKTQYWGLKWALYVANASGFHFKKDHRITKAVRLTNKKHK